MASFCHLDDAPCDRRQLLDKTAYLDFVIEVVRRLDAEPVVKACRDVKCDRGYVVFRPPINE
jgi:hypothetical protein